jgi:hypothetical protein
MTLIEKIRQEAGITGSTPDYTATTPAQRAPQEPAANDFIQYIRDYAGLSNTDGWMSPDWAASHPEDAQGLLTRQQRQDFERRYIPIENELIARTSTNGEAEADLAGGRAARQMGVSRGEFMRNLRRSGQSLTPDERANVDRKFGLARAKSVANAENTTRRDVESRNVDLQGDIIGIGKNITAGANSALFTAANLQNQREAVGDAARTDYKRGLWSTAATAAGIAAVMI